jgi:hypothetical protein
MNMVHYRFTQWNYEKTQGDILQCSSGRDGGMYHWANRYPTKNKRHLERV